MTHDEEILEAVIDIVRSEVQKYEPLACVGEVTAVNPLKVKVGSYTIDEDFMVIDSSCRKTVINIPVDSDNEHIHEEDDALAFTVTGATAAGPVTFTVVPSGEGSIPQVTTTVDFKHKHTIKKALPKILVYRGLKVGDKVNVLRIGSIHIIRGRVGVQTNDGTLDDDGSEQL